MIMKKLAISFVIGTLLGIVLGVFITFNLVNMLLTVA
jgi:ABC-type nitrate/sulfonate/bicarbonate transport system permease component